MGFNSGFKGLKYTELYNCLLLYMDLELRLSR